MSSSRYLTNENDRYAPLPLLQYISYSKYDFDWVSIPHSHPFAEFAFIQAGEGSFFIDGNTYCVQEGDLITIPPNKLHTEKPAQTNNLEYFIMGVENIVINAIYPAENTVSFNPVQPLNNAAGKTSRLFNSIYHETKNRADGYFLMAQSRLLEFITFLIRQTDMEAAPAPHSPIRRDCAMAKQFIDERYADTITLTTLSQLCNISKFHLIREFTRQVGISPIAYLIKKRIEEARILLASTEMSIAAIAMAVGFPSASQFSQRFRKEQGIAPMQYRMQTRKAEKSR